MNKLSEEHSLLVEDIGMVIEERADLSPLAARIYASLILCPVDGMTFEEITEAHHASKSSVSNNLNVLVKLNYIEYYTKPGERKRHFRSSRAYIKTAMEKYNELFEKEARVVEKINAFNKQFNPEKFKNQESVGTIYQDFLDEMREGLKKRIEKVKALQIQS
ncbi:GbsR/MarR family transcriptional regulator [Nonlabens antarcticus]|uniref:GbsR/MarR family transcriptional regulator n=1 Tax=Nonlabens antarcticus TaxID=392714 RepID=UPI001E292D95|nr:hypothetical protein [Nonlabens antarcticus]